MAGGAAPRLRLLFDRQHQVLTDYLRLIEAQRRSLEDRDMDRLASQLEVERDLLTRLEGLQKAARGLEAPYRAACPAGDRAAEDARARAARAAAAVAATAQSRRGTLEHGSEEIARSLAALRRTLARLPRSTASTPGIVDICG
jgi:hypothetical protein